MSGYLDRLDRWIQQHQGLLQASGRVHHSKSPEDGRDNKAANLVVLREPDEVELLLWASGEAEFSYGPLAGGTTAHHDLGSLVELDHLLARLSEIVLDLHARGTRESGLQ